jgi:hypothetical protein
MGIRITVWEPGKPWRNAVAVPLAIVLVPAAIVVALVASVFVRSRRETPEEFAASVTTLIEDGKDFDFVFDDIQTLQIADPRLEALRRRVNLLGDPPWNTAAIDELKAIRESALALTSGGVA